MNRSGSRNRRNNGNRMPLSSARQNLHQPTENEPIMMEYLQHIDRELNELKKKREIIEQQHGYFQSPMEDGHNRPDQKRELLCSTTRYYEQFYDDPEPSHSSYYKESYGFPAQNDDYISFNSGRKRPNPWQNNDEPKRFSGFDGDNVEKLFGSRLGPKTSSRYFNEPVNYNQRYRQHKNTAPSKRNAGPSQKPKPLMSYDVRDSYSSARKEYRSKNKISKPKAASARPPNKLNAYPVATRKDLIEKTTKADAYPVATRKALAGSTKQADASPVATQKASAEPSKQADACLVTGQKASVGPTSKASADNDASMILKTDGNLTPKIRGRLELALGHILKSMKEKKSMEDKADIGKQSINMQRIVKQIIRERLKNVMLGKRVGSYVEIAAAYRERFPVDTDEKMLIAAHGTALSNIKYKTADSAEEFLKLNIHDVLEKKLREMFQQLEEIYSGMKKSLKGEDKVEIKDATATSEDKDATASTSVDKNATASTSEDKNATASTSEDKNATASTSEDKNATASTSEDKNATASTSEDKDATASTSEDKNATASTSEDKDATASTSEDKDATDSTSEDKDMVIIKDVLDNGGIPEECKKLMFPVEDLDNILDEKLPKLLMSFIPRLTEIMKLDYRYESSTAEVIINTNGFKAYSKRLQQITRAVAKGVSGNNKKEKKSNNVQAMTGEEQTNTSPMYYLKLIGRPTLPKRKPMQSFLDKFKPTMIKKHKKQSNLLFIGFTDKKYYDHLLSKNGASFGKIIIDIKPSEPTKTNGGAAENETSGADTKDGESSQPNEENDTSFDSELDDQINELLLSIRQSEEDNDSDIVEPTTTEMTQSGNYDSDDKDQNRVTIIYDSDDEKNEEKSEGVAEKTEDITEKMEVDTANMDDITEETRVTEKTNDGTEKTDDITEEKDDVDEKTDNITEEDEDVADKTDNITEENEDVADKTDNITDGSEAVADKTNDITEEDEDVADKIEDITEEKEDVTEKTDEAIKTTPELVVKVENDVQIETSSEKDTIDEDNMQQVKEQVTSNEEGQANTEDVEAVSKNEENSVQNDSDNVKDAKKDGIVKESVRATPTRTSSRLATVKPTTIQTRRASRMTQNNE